MVGQTENQKIQSADLFGDQLDTIHLRKQGKVYQDFHHDEH